MNESSAMTRDQWCDQFISEGIRLGVNADVVDSVLRMLEARVSWDHLRHSSPVMRARAQFIFESEHD